MTLSATTRMQITSPNHRISLEVLEYGLTVHKLKLSLKDGTTIDVIPGPENAEDHQKSRSFLHTIIGRYTNRVPVGNHEIERGVFVTPEPVESEQVSHHGGIDAFDRKRFTSITLSESQLYSNRDALPAHTMALFKYVSSSGENGYPGAMLVEAAFYVGDESIVLTHRATMLDGVACPINLTQHWGFNLTADKFRSSTIADHELYLNSHNIADTDTHTNLATGKSVGIDGTAFDFNTQRRIGEREIIHDHYYFFDRDASSVDRTIAQSLEDIRSARDVAQSQQPQLKLESGDVALHFNTNQSGVMFYAGGGFDGSAPHRKACHIDERDKDSAYPKHGCAFFEFHHPLSTFLHKEYETHANTSTILNRQEGNVYQNWVKIDVLLK